MIVADSSVWIAYLRRERTPGTAKLARLADGEHLLVGDLIMLEILQGARDQAHAARMEHTLRLYDVVPLLNADLAPLVAGNLRTLRGLGITIRKTVDLIIGTFCIEHQHELLHNDRDFLPMQQHLGLRSH